MSGAQREHSNRIVNKIKLVALDLDDTLLRDDGTVSERTVTALRKVREKGIMTVIATGRMYATAKPYADVLKLGNIPLILFSGGLIQLSETKEKLFERPLSVDTVTKINAMAETNGWTVQTYIDDVLYVRSRNELVRAYEAHTGIRAVACATAERIPRGKANKMLALGTASALNTVQQRILAEVGKDVEVLFSRPAYLEIVAACTSKGRALEALCGYYRIRLSEAMSFGNGENDTAMLKVAGFSVAVGNAVDEVKDAASYVAPTNNEDGVAEALERFVL